jgi:hypothetical protein
MQQPTVNRFYRGLDSDTSLTERGQDVYLNGHNIRLVRREAGSLWAANIKGTEETFQLREGHIPLGSVEFDGFLFIASVNPDTGLSEIGSFPSYDDGGQLVRAYRPFRNFSSVDITTQVGDDCLLPDSTLLDPLATTSLNFQCTSPILMLARLDFDGSVNLYFTDNLNPWRVVNSGFILETGELNGRYITENQIINGFINGINENEKHPNVNLLNLQPGGSLAVGNYFLFIRYTDLNFSSTSYLGQSGPIPIFNTLNAGVQIPFGGEANSITDKAMLVQVSDLDTTAGFFEVGFIRYFAEDQFETFLIDKRYSIQGQDFRNITITGNEPLVPITLDELVAYKPSDALICKTMEHTNNVLYLGNTRGPRLDHPDLRKFMCALTLSEGITNNGRAPEIRNDRNDNPYGLDANDTEEKVGYFSGEAYIFAAIPVFKNGFVGLPYPVTGVDNYNGLAANANKSGIYRFSRASVTPYWDGNDTFIKSIQVNTTNAQTVYNGSQWLKDNLVGIYIARGERNKILLYQGLSLRCYNGNLNPEIQRRDRQFNRFPASPGAPIITWDGDREDWRTDRVVPLFEPASYSMCSNRESSIGAAIASGNFAYYFYAPPYQIEGRNDFTDPARLGIFSLDYFLDDIDVPDTSYVQMVGTTQYADDWNRESTGKNVQAIYNTNALYKYTGQVNGTTLINDTDYTVNALQNPIIPLPDRGHAPTFVGYNQLGIDYTNDGFSSATVNVTGFQVTPSQGFASRFDEGRIASQDGLYYFQRNAFTNNASEYDISLPFAVPGYIGVTNAPTYAPTPAGGGGFNHYEDKWDRAIVNVCRANPDSIDYLDLYDFKNTEFYQIGGFQPIDDFLGQTLHEYFRGDCLVQRQYLKIVHGSIENLSDSFLDIISANIPANTDPLVGENNNGASAPDELLDGWGHWVSVVVEARYNQNYRHELGRNLFYPKTNVDNPGQDFAWLFDSPESPFYNRGYLRMLGPRAGIGIDLLQPTSNNKFPTRIRPSITHIFGAVRDGYRQFIPADAKDFEYKFGEINVLMSNFDMLYSFQERAINIHPINERVTQQGNDGSTAILGQSTGLTQYRRIVTDRYGVQHRFGVVKANAGLYAIDWNKRSFIRVAGPQVQILDVEKRFQTWFRDIIAQGSSGYSDVLDVLPDQHPCNKGIHGAYNRKYKEVIFTLRLGEVDYTVVFSELADAMYGTHGYKPLHYAMVEEDLYSFIDNRGWLHDVTEKYDTFYGVVDEWSVKFVTNEGGNITNHWDRQIISSNNRRFKSIAYETQHQTALQDPFVNEAEFWYAPTYRENSWRLPIRRADATKEPEENIYDDFGETGTPLRGRYLITELTYDEDKELWLREVITFKTQSFT